MRYLSFCALACAVSAILPGQETRYAFSTFAGRALTNGTTDGIGAAARFDRPYGVAVDAAGNLFVSEAIGHTVRKIAPDGTVTTLAGQAGNPGSADGNGTVAQFGGIVTSAGLPSSTTSTGPFGLAVLPSGNVLVTDSHYHLIRQITPGGAVSRFAGGFNRQGSFDGSILDSNALFALPTSLAVDASGNIFVADTLNHVIRRITPAGIVSTIIGSAGIPAAVDGIGTAARLSYPTAIAVSRSGAVYVADGSHTVRRLVRSQNLENTWEITTLAGKPYAFGTADGTGDNARFSRGPTASTTGVPIGLLASFSIPPNTVINIVPPGDYVIGGLVGIAVDAGENVFVTDFLNNTIRKVTQAGVVTTIGGTTATGSTDGLATASRFNRPAGIAIDAAGILYIADYSNSTIRRAAPAAAPVITEQPAGVTVSIGGTVTLDVAATGSPNPTYQWRRNGVNVTGATGATLTLTNVQTAQAGTYTVFVTNSVGNVTSTGAVVVVTAAPAISVQPASQTVNGGATVTLRVTASGAPAYQWTKDGAALAGATASTLVLTGVQEENAGEYRVVLTNANGTVTSNVARLVVNAGRIVNLSIRTTLTGANPLIAGFVVAGGSKPLLIRAIGPALRQFGVGTAMADPQLILQVGSDVITTNDNWTTSATATQVAAAAGQVGAFPLTENSLDAAVLATVTNAAVTGQASAQNGAGGVVLLELYDTGAAGPARLVNVSTRAQVGVGENALFAGFSLGGNAPKTLLIRAIGPTLGTFGVTGVLADPLLEIFAAGVTTPRSTNDNWGGSAALTATFNRVGAFLLPTTTSRDSVIMTSFTPGTYSAKVSGVGNTIGEVLLEIYEVQ